MNVGATTVVHVHIQKAAGTALYLHCVERCAGPSGRRLQGFVAQVGNRSVAANRACGCRSFFDFHWTLYELRPILAAAGVPTRLSILLREPVARLVSEYHFLTSTRNGPAALHQDQWDYLSPPPESSSRRQPVLSVLARRMLARTNLSLSQYVEAAHNPAHNRMTRYLSALGPGRIWVEPPYPQRCCLGSGIARDAVLHWAMHQGGERAAAKIVGVFDRFAAESRAALSAGRSGWGWRRDLRAAKLNLARFDAVGLVERAGDSARVFEAAFGWTRSWTTHQPAYHAPAVSERLRQRILELNADDVELYREAARLLDERLRLV